MDLFCKESRTPAMKLRKLADLNLKSKRIVLTDMMKKDRFVRKKHTADVGLECQLFGA